MSDICYTCKVSKSMNKAELEKVIPDWYKEIGNYSLLPPMLNNNDKYNYLLMLISCIIKSKYLSMVVSQQ